MLLCASLSYDGLVKFGDLSQEASIALGWLCLELHLFSALQTSPTLHYNLTWAKAEIKY